MSSAILAFTTPLGVGRSRLVVGQNGSATTSIQQQRRRQQQRVCVGSGPARMVLSDRHATPSSKEPKSKVKAKAGSGKASKKPKATMPARTSSMTTSTSDDVPLRITGNNITLTESLHDYVADKVGKVTKKFGNLLTKVDVHLQVEHNPSIRSAHKAEVVVFAGKTILRNEVRSDDMYAAIDAVEERIRRTIRKYKERRKESARSRAIANDDNDDENTKDGQAVDLLPIPGVNSANAGDDPEANAYLDTYQNEAMPGVPAVTDVVRRKVFPMPLQTVEEAVLCCEYVDHPWYLFRNAESKEICLVYKRNHGGYGLIEPSNPDSKNDEQVL